MIAPSRRDPPVASGHVFIATSVDGFIARTDGAIDWLERYPAGSEDTGYDAFMKSVDGLVMGRGTFQTALAFPTWPYQKPVVVLRRTLSQGDIRPDLASRVRVSSLLPTALMAALAGEGWRRAYVDGGKVIQSFLREGLIDDLVVTRVPVLLGTGLPLFGATGTDVDLRHVRTVSFASGLVQTTYEVV